MMTIRLSDAYRAPMHFALVLQVLIGLACTAILDGGVLGRTAGVLTAAFWMGAAIIMIRRPMRPTTVDLLYMRWGYLALWPIGMGIISAIGMMMYR